jgi:hypothetical protein
VRPEPKLGTQSSSSASAFDAQLELAVCEAAQLLGRQKETRSLLTTAHGKRWSPEIVSEAAQQVAERIRDGISVRNPCALFTTIADEMLRVNAERERHNALKRVKDQEDRVMAAVGLIETLRWNPIFADHSKMYRAVAGSYGEETATRAFKILDSRHGSAPSGDHPEPAGFHQRSGA